MQEPSFTKKYLNWLLRRDTAGEKDNPAIEAGLREMYYGTRATSWNAEHLFLKSDPSMSGREKRRAAPRAINPDRPPLRGHYMRRTGGRVGMMLVIILIGLATGVFIERAGDKEENIEQVFSTEKGERSQLKLSDGSLVTLGVNSTLQIVSDFSEGSREVVLDGEAFFDVTADPEHPFRIHARHAVIQVLGTNFGVNAYPESDPVEVIVTEGRVAVGSEISEGQPTLLEHMQLGVIELDGNVRVYKDVNPETYLAWMDGHLVFEDSPFREVIVELERWYDLEVEVTDSSFYDMRMTATYQNESLPFILNAISKVLGLEYESNQRKVTFYRK